MKDSDRNAIEAEMMRRQFAELENQMNLLENKRLELDMILNSIEGLEGQKDKEIVIPIGSGVLTRGTLTDDKRVLINVGANIIVEKTFEEAKQIIAEQIKEIETARETVQEEAKKFIR